MQAEGFDAKQLELLGNVIAQRRGRAIDLLQTLDNEKTGKASRGSFHKAVLMLGLQTPKSATDQIFNRWDRNQCGELDIDELHQRLDLTAEIDVVGKE